MLDRFEAGERIKEGVDRSSWFGREKVDRSLWFG